MTGLKHNNQGVEQFVRRLFWVRVCVSLVENETLDEVFNNVKLKKTF